MSESTGLTANTSGVNTNTIEVRYKLTYALSEKPTGDEIKTAHEQINAALKLAVNAEKYEDVQELSGLKTAVDTAGKKAVQDFYGTASEALAVKLQKSALGFANAFLVQVKNSNSTIPAGFSFAVTVTFDGKEFSANKATKSGFGTNPVRKSATGTGDRTGKTAEFSNGKETLAVDAFIDRFYTEGEKNHSLMKIKKDTGRPAWRTHAVKAALARNPGWAKVEA